MKEIYASLDVFDYSGNKLCGLYDSQNDIVGQAYDVQYSFNMTDGISELTFNIPYMIDGENNFRWDYLKSEYMIRFFYNNKEYWFIAKKPTKRKEGKAIVGSVTCKGIESSLKTKNIYMEFDDTNGIGTADELLDKILAGTDWRRGETDTLYEKDGVTEKVRSISSGDKQGALGLIVKLCNLFKCYPVFRNDVKLVDLHAYNNRTQLFEGEVGKNLDSLSVGYNSDDIITRLYVEGEYGENGYVGIDSVNPTGLNYIMNFDYYREIGVMTQAQEAALEQYTTDIAEIKAEISDNTQRSTALDDDLNLLIGQCQIAVYYKASGFTTPVYLYGDPLETRVPLAPGDNVVVLQNDGTFRYETIETTPEAIVTANDYGIAKFIRKAAGKVGTKEVSIEAKQKTINDLQRKIDATTKQDVIDKYTAEIAELNDQIEHVYVGADVDPSIKDQLVTKYIPVGYDGNTDITDRIIVPASTIRAAYDDFDGTYETLYPMSCSAGTGSDYDYQYGTNVVITYTPIKANGTVMTPAQVNNYMSNVVENATSHSTGIMEEDPQNLILRVYEIPDNKTLAEGLSDANRWSTALHDLQTAWDRVRASYNWFGDPTRDPAKIFGNTEDTSVGLYPMMHNIMKTDGMLHDRKALSDEYDALSVEQDEIEADFIVAMGDLLRDGYWQSNNYIPGQEQALYDDAVERLEILSRPSVSYQFGYLRVMEEFGIPMEDIKLNAVIMIHDNDLNVHDDVFITKITIGVSDQRLGTITVSNQEITFSANDLGSLISRMSQLSDLLDQRNTLYERAKAISKDGSIFIDRLNGQIDVMKNQILSSVSNWYTDEQGNIMFESADGTSAMMLSGAGWMIASSKDDDGNWVWRTAATGAGLSADVITAGFISTERLESNSISVNHLQPNVGSSLVISGNPTITNINDQIAPAFSPEQDYSEGDIVMHNGILFVFTQDHPAGPWNSNHVMSTSMTTQIELLPDRIISYVGEQGYSRTFTQSYEPTDPNKGDRWVVPGMKWGDVYSDGSNTWRNIRERFVWQELLTGKSLYYNGSEWTDSPEAAAINTMYTRIEQSENEIRQEAARTYLAKADDYQNVNDIINKAEQLAEDSAESAMNASIAKTDRYQSASAIVESAVAVVGGDTSSLEVFSTTKQYYKGDAVKYNNVGYVFTTDHKGAWNASHVKEIVPYIAQTTTYQTADSIVSSAQTYTNNKLTDYSTSEQTSTMISNYVTNNAYKLVSGITIQAAGIKISGAKYLKLESGAYIDVAASNIRIGNNKTVASLEEEISNKSSISTLTAQYYVSTSPTTPTGGSWSTTVPTHQDNRYIWTRTKVDYSDGTATKYIPSTNGICTEGVPGDTGSPGKGISSVTEHYLASSKSTGVTTSESGWTTSIQTPTKTKRYLWNYETINYSNPTSSSNTTPVIIGMYSEDGVSITGVTEYYLASASSSGVTRSTSGWTTTIQTISASKPYLWNYEAITYSTGDPSYTDPVIIGTRGTNGSKGDSGTGISSIVVKYRAHSSYTVDPENGRTAAQIESDWTNLWSTTAPSSFDENKRYLWTWTRTTLSDGTKNDFRVSEYGVNAAYDLAKDAADAAGDIIAGRQNAFYAKNIENTGVTVDNTTLHVTSSGNMYIDTGGSLYIRSTSSTSSNPQNAVVINKTGIAIESTGNITIKNNGNFTVNTGGKFLVNASNFSINAQNKSMTIGSFTFDEKGFTFKDTDLTSMRFGSNVYMDETSAVGIGMSTHGETYGGSYSRIKDIVFKTGYQNINKITERYLLSNKSSGVTRSTSGWTTDKTDIYDGGGYVGMTMYVWNYKTISFNGGANIYTTPEVIATVQDGDSVEEIRTYYLASSQSTGVTRSTSGWGTSVPALSESASYLWCYVRTKISLNTNYQYSTPFMAAQWTKSSEIVLYYDRMLFGYMASIGAFSLYPDIAHEYAMNLGLSIAGCRWDNAYINNIYYSELEAFSSRYIKHDIKPMEDFGSAIDHLEPVSFIYNNDKTNKKRYGLIYEDTIEYMPEICHNDGENKSLVYSELIPILLNEIKSLRSRVKALEQ